MQDYYVFYTKKTRPGKHCENSECKYEQGHYHCKMCPVAFKGLMTDKMVKHVRSKHPHQINIASKPGNDPQNSHSDNANSGTKIKSGDNSASNPASELFSPVSLSPLKGVAIKKSKVSTPLYADPGNVQFSSPGISPLFHKAVTVTEPSSLTNVIPSQVELSQIVTEPAVDKDKVEAPECRCVVPDCTSVFKLKSLVRRKLRGGGNNDLDWESTMLLITYFRLDKIGDPFAISFCNKHWKNWYHYNYKIKQALSFYVDGGKDRNQFLTLIDAVSDTNYNPSTQLLHVIPGLFFEEASHLLIYVLNNLNLNELKTLSLTCKFMNQKVKKYLQDDAVWKRLLIEHFFVNRKLNGKTYHESFRAIDLYCSERNQQLCELNAHQPTISFELMRELNVSLKNNNNLDKMLRAFGQNRNPLPIEILVYFTAKCLYPYFLSYNQLVKQSCENEPLVSDFRVGTEISSTPFILMLFDLVLTGNEMTQPCNPLVRSTLFKCLSIHTIRQKMRDCKAITPLQKVLSNEVSLTCSKNLMSTLNKTGLSYSYSKDLKDSKVARHVWNTIGIKSSVQTTPSNLHWIETDNLETMLKSTSIHNAEKLTHFLTSQLEYVTGQHVLLDLFERPQAQNIQPAENIFNITLGQIDTEFDDNLSSFLEQEVQPQVQNSEEEDDTLFAFEEWLQNRR